jgi:hypothetical protein
MTGREGKLARRTIGRNRNAEEAGIPDRGDLRPGEAREDAGRWTLDAGRWTLDAEKVGQIAESGLHRLGAMKALGEKTIEGYLVQPQKH